MHPRLSIIAASIRRIISAIVSTTTVDQFWDRTVLNMRMETADPYWDKKVLGLHCNGTNGSTTFTDVKGNTVTANGNAQISTAQYPALTGKTSSGYFDGNGDFLTVPDSDAWHFGNGDFTLRAKIRLTAYATVNNGYYTASIISQDLDTSRAFALNINGTASSYTSLSFAGFADNLTGYTTIELSYSFSLNTWYDIECCRSGNLVYLFVNGVLLNSGGTAFSRTIQNSTTTLKIGAEEYDTTYHYYFPGYISEVEIYKGVALHTSNFYPLITEFPEPTPIDDKGTTITSYGAICLQGTEKKYGTGALLFDGSNDYLSIPNSGNYDFGTSDFTIELWAKFSATTAAILVDGRGTAQDFACAWFFTLNGSQKIFFGADSAAYNTNGGSWEVSLTSTTSIITGRWYHIAVCRSGTSWKLFVDGVNEASSTVTLTVGATSPTVYIGTGCNGVGTLGYRLSGYIDDLRITKGFARYTSNFTPTYIGSEGPPGDPYYNYTSLLLKMNGANNSTTFTDDSYSPKTVTAAGNAKISTVKSVSSDASGYFDGTGDYVSFTAGSEFDLGTGDFTIEVWANPSASTEQYFIVKCVTWVSNLDFAFRINPTGYASFLAGDTAPITLISDAVLPLYTWTHIAVVRASGVSKMFINGIVQTSTHTGSVTIPNDATTVYIGAFQGTSDYYTGYIDDLRITKGVARYTANFTPPGALPSTVHADTDPWWLNTVLALRMDGIQGSTTFTDLKGKTVTPTGNTHISTVKSKFGQAAYFDGTGDYLSVPNSTDFDFGSGNFTIDGWINTSNASSNIISKRPDVSWGPFSLIVNAGKLNARYCVTAGSLAIDISSTDSINTGSWVHFAVVRSGSSFLLFVNGTLQAATGTNASSLLTVTDPVYIGGNSDASGILTGYIDDLRITKGIARWTTTFTPPTKPLPTDVIGPAHDANWDYKVLGLHMNGADNSTTFTDCKNRTITVVGDTKIRTTQFAPLTNNLSSAYFDGAGDTLSIANSSDFNFGTTPDFTISFWIRIPATPSVSQYILNKDGKYGSYYPQYHISINTNRLLAFECGSGGGGATIDQLYNVDWPVPIDVWTHVEFGRTGTTLQLFQNGHRIATLTQTATMGNSSEPLTIGFQPNSPSGYFQGFIDDLEIYKGVALHTASFIPPTAPFIDG